MARNLSLPAHLQEKDSRGVEKLKLTRTPRKPTACQPGPSLSNPRSTNDIVRGLFTCEPDTVTVRHESRPYNIHKQILSIRLDSTSSIQRLSMSHVHCSRDRQTPFFSK